MSQIVSGIVIFLIVLAICGDCACVFLLLETPSQEVSDELLTCSCVLGVVIAIEIWSVV